MTNGRELIRELLADPLEFNERGSAYGLLQAYFAGFPVETLRPLLRSGDPLIQRAAVFVASELGDQARPLVDDVIPLMESGDRYLQYNAMEITAVCCDGEQAGKFAHVVLQLGNDDPVLRVLAMRLMSKADVAQLAAAGQRLACGKGVHSAHEIGLRALTAEDNADSGVVAQMIHASEPLLRRYGAIVAKRLLRKLPVFMNEVASSDDPDLQAFNRDTLAPTE